MAIPMSALRRALAEVARDPRVERTLAAPMPGAIAGGGFGGAIGALNGHTEDGELGQDILTGAGIGAGLGVAGAGSMIRTSLREALAASAAERGIGRAAAREASHVDDAARFAEASEGRRGMMQRVGDYISENPEEVALAGAGASMGVLGGGGLLAIGGGMAAQYQRAQQATGIEDLTMMTPQELAVLGSPKLGEQSAEGEMLRQQAVEIMRQRQKMAQ